MVTMLSCRSYRQPHAPVRAGSERLRRFDWIGLPVESGPRPAAAYRNRAAARLAPSFKGAFVGIATVSFQEQLEIFSSANPAGCPTVSSQILPPAISLHFIRRHKKTCYLLSDTTPFRRFAPIMRQGRGIQYFGDIQLQGCQSAQGGFPARPGPTYPHFHFSQSVLFRLGDSIAQRALRRKRSRFSGALEA